MPTLDSVVRCDPDVLGGTPVFAGTRPHGVELNFVSGRRIWPGLRCPLTAGFDTPAEVYEGGRGDRDGRASSKWSRSPIQSFWLATNVTSAGQRV